MCKIADIVVVGGVRRSAMISLSDVTDDRMRSAKSGEWWTHNGQRRLANNSAVYPSHRPDMELFMKEWFSLYASKSGERGMFSRYACQKIAARNGGETLITSSEPIRVPRLSFVHMASVI
jgi:ribonucleoside-triphosphate reductase